MRRSRASKRFFLVGTALNLGSENLVAEILDDQQSLIEIFSKDLRRRNASFAQRIRDGDESSHVFREMRDGAVGFSIADWRAIGSARRIDEKRARAIPFGEPRITSRRCIALQIDEPRVRPAPARSFDKCPDCREALQPFGERRDRTNCNRSAAFVVAFLEQKRDGFGRDAIAASRWPFDDRHSAGQRRLEPKLVELCWVGEAIKVEMRDFEARRLVALRQREGRARNVEGRIAGKRPDQGACERRFTCAEVAFEAKRIAGLKKKSHLVGKAHDVVLGQIAKLK